VRPPVNDTIIIKRLLNAGFYNFLVPFIESAEEARRAVAAIPYPPEGIRGVLLRNAAIAMALSLTTSPP
jgi:2-dehydro-3-deoxyglucarate aldolase